MSRGFPLSELDKWNTGSLINWMYEYDRKHRQANGEEVHDDYKRYQTLKSIEPQIEDYYQNGKIEKDRYESYKKSLAEAEKMLKG